MTAPDFVPGLELSRRFYLEAVLPILDKEVPGLPHSVARLGSGSEVLGFDTARSSDHDWGPRLQLFLAPDDVERLVSAFAYQLPKTFLDYPTWIDVAGVDDWLTGFLGFTPSRGVTTADWLATPTQRLLEATSGAVFHDGSGSSRPIGRGWRGIRTMCGCTCWRASGSGSRRRRPSSAAAARSATSLGRRWCAHGLSAT